MEIEEQVVQKIRQRRDAGREKYGTTMERNDLTELQWLNHLQEELMDAVIYLERVMRGMKWEACDKCDDGIKKKPDHYCWCRRGFQRRVLDKMEERKEIDAMEDGLYYYFPGTRGCVSSDGLRVIADELDRRNAEYLKGIDKYFQYQDK